MNGYNLLRDWYNYKFAHPSKVKAVHSDMYCYLIDLWNRLGQKNEFGLPTQVTMEALGIGSYNTYKKTFDDLIEFGFVKLVADSKNQYQSRIIALSKNDKAHDEATDKALDKAHIKATDIIDKQETNNNNKLSSTEDPWQGGCVGPTEDPSQQEKEKEEGKVKEKVKEKPIDERKLEFASLLAPFLEKYGRRLLNDFYHYWTEHGEKDKKLRFEKQTTFGIEQRLRTWYKRNPEQYNQDNDVNPPEYYLAKQQGL